MLNRASIFNGRENPWQDMSINGFNVSILEVMDVMNY